MWYDHARGMGGGILDLIETVLGYDRRAALAWLAHHLGASLDNHPLSSDDRRGYEEHRARAESVARELTEWRTGHLDSLRERRKPVVGLGAAGVRLGAAAPCRLVHGR